MPTKTTTPKLLTSGEAERYISRKLGIPREAIGLRSEANKGRGPRHHVWGRDRFYSESDLDAWAASRWSESGDAEQRKAG